MKISAALKISIIYLVLGFLWILFSDKVLLSLTNEFNELSKIQTFKGWFYVLATAFLLFMLVHREIKKNNVIEDKLRKAMLKAEESDRMKSAFLANMSHEIRTPLNGIMGFSSLLQENNYSEEQKKEFLKHIVKNGESLLVLINDIIDISQLQEKLLDIVPIDFQINELMDNIYMNFSEILRKKGGSDVEIILENGFSDENILVHSDPIRIGQILNNLMGNAIKYTNQGKVVLGCKLVEDTGIGIPKEHLTKIFDRFYTSRTLNIGERRFGLGLSISKGLVELLGGTISAESTIDVGSKFSFFLPLSIYY